MKTTKILPIAIIAALPFTANAANIQGAMYTAPARETNLTPAPTTIASAPYGRINIDTDDQEHIATTAYVKGAYNSAIAAVNKVDSDKQEKLLLGGSANLPMGSRVATPDELADTYSHYLANPEERDQIRDDERGYVASVGAVLAAMDSLSDVFQEKMVTTDDEPIEEILTADEFVDNYLLVNGTLADSATDGSLNTTLVTGAAVAGAMDSLRVNIYTTWDDDRASATTQVPLSLVSASE